MAAILIRYERTTGSAQRSLVVDRAWYERAECRPGAAVGVEVDPRWFDYHHPDSPPAAAKTELARQVCRRCPVRTDCLQDAIETDDVGRYAQMRGGMTGTERLRLRRAAQHATGLPQRRHTRRS